MASLAHVSVVEDLDHLAWIAASQAMAHTSSTTGLEAYLLGTPSINLSPDSDRFSEHFLANIVNPTFAEIDAAAAFINAAVGADGSAPDQSNGFQTALRDHLLVDPADSAAARIARAVLDIHPDPSSDRPPPRPVGPFITISNTARQKEKAWIDFAGFAGQMEAVWRRLSRAGVPSVEEVGPSVFRISDSAASNGGEARGTDANG
jgi:hypothetical protein